MKILFLDLETGGLDSNEQDFLSLGYIVYDSNINEILKQDELFLKRRTFRITAEAMLINKFDFNNTVKYGLSDIEIQEHLKEIVERYKIDTIAGYNVRFDLDFIKQIEYNFNKKVMDLYSIVLFLENRTYKLKEICEKYGIVNNAQHTALADTKATLDLYNYYRTKYSITEQTKY